MSDGPDRCSADVMASQKLLTLVARWLCTPNPSPSETQSIVGEVSSVSALARSPDFRVWRASSICTNTELSLDSPGVQGTTFLKVITCCCETGRHPHCALIAP